jgi:hypothetical protein
MQRKTNQREELLDERDTVEKLRDKRETNILGKYKLINAIS